MAIACRYAGDILNDYKSGHILKANPQAQFVSELIGGLVGTVVATVAMIADHPLRRSRDRYLPAPQAKPSPNGPRPW